MGRTKKTWKFCASPPLESWSNTKRYFPSLLHRFHLCRASCTTHLALVMTRCISLLRQVIRLIHSLHSCSMFTDDLRYTDRCNLAFTLCMILFDDWPLFVFTECLTVIVCGRQTAQNDRCLSWCSRACLSSLQRMQRWRFPYALILLQIIERHVWFSTCFLSPTFSHSAIHRLVKNKWQRHVHSKSNLSLSQITVTRTPTESSFTASANSLSCQQENTSCLLESPSV